MRNLTNKVIAIIFRQFADKIENNTCEVDSDTLVDIANKLIHIKMNAEQTCSFLGVSRATLTRMVCDGRVPHPHKDRGGDKYWYQDEVEDYMRKYKEKYKLN